MACNRYRLHRLLTLAACLLTGGATGQITQVQADWLSAADGDWSAPANWSSADFPDNAGFTFYDVLIDATGSPYSVTLSNFNIDIDSLVLDSADATLRLFGSAVLSADEIALNNGTLNFFAGRIEDATITAVNGRIQTDPGERFQLDSVTIASDLEFHISRGSIHDSLALSGGAVLDFHERSGHSAHSLTLSGASPRIAGTGTLRFNDDIGIGVDIGSIGTIEAGVTLETVGTTLSLSGGRMVNMGSIIASGNTSGFHVVAGTHSFSNEGLVEGFNNTYIRFESNWSNLGTIRVHDTAYLELGGNFSLSDIGTIESLDDATVSINGVVTLQPGDVFEIDGSIQGLELNGATLQGGRVIGVDENNFDRVTTATLDGTAIESLDLTGSVWFIRNGLELDNASLRVDGGFSHLQSYQFQGPQSITGTGRLVTVNGTAFRFGDGHTVFGQGITIDATNGSAELGVSSNGSWENQGTIHVGAGWWADFRGDWTNAGNVLLDDGALLLITGDFQTSDLGTLTGTSDATVRVHHNTQWDNAGQTADFSAIFGDLQLDLSGNRITGGILTTSQPFDFEPSVFLHDVTVDFDWDMRAHPNRGPVVEGDLTIAAGRTVTLSTNGQLRWDGAQPYTLSGGGTVVATGDEAMEVGGDGLAIAAGVTVQNGDAFGVGPDLELKVQTNHGTILQNASTRTLLLDGSGQDNHGTLRATIGTLRADTLTNHGLIEAGGGNGRIDLLGTTTNTGTLRAICGGVLDLVQLTNTGNLDIASGGQATINGAWDNTGGMIHVNQGRLILAQASANAGTITVDQGTIRLGYDLHISDLAHIPQGVGSSIELAGTLDLTNSVLQLDLNPSRIVLVGGRIAGNEQINGDAPLWVSPSDDGSASTLEHVTMLSDMTLTGDARLNLVGSVSFYDSVIIGGDRISVLDAGTVRLDRTQLGTTLEARPGADVTIAGGGASLTNQGTLNILYGSNVQATLDSFSSTGQIQVTGGSSFQVNAALFEVSNDLILNGTIGSTGSDLHITGGGAIIGQGAIDLDATHRLDVDGTLHVSSIGIGLDIDGSLLLQPGSRFEANPLTSSSLTLQVTGDAQLDGTMALQTNSLHGIELDDEITLVQAGAVTGSFSQVDGLGIDEQLAWSIRYEGNQVVARATVAGDINGDLFVGVQDLELLLSQWGTPVAAGDSTLGDLDGDGWVGTGDLDRVIASWGNGFHPETSVPEPGSLVMYGGLAALFIRRKSRRHSLCHEGLERKI